MAKKKLGDLVSGETPKPKSTEAEPQEEGRTVPTGVGLKESVIVELDELAQELGVARNAIMRFMVRHCLKEIREGRLKIPVETETKSKVSGL